MKYEHTPVLLNEVLENLAPKTKDSLFIDCNTAEAGHSFEFLNRFHDLKAVCIEVDENIFAIGKERLAPFGNRVYFYSGWSYDFFTNYPSELKRPNIILFDLGISNFHYKKSGRGFSFEKDEFLDMRLDSKGGVTAADLLASLPEKELADLFYNNADERYSRRIASAIVNERQKGKIVTTSALASIVEKAVPAPYRHGRVHPATKTFQALRIAVNKELSQLFSLLEAALGILEPGGRLGVISFHSLEDRIVKNFFKEKNKDCTCPETEPICKCRGFRSVEILTKKGIAATDEEIERNPPSRSARLRVVEKVLDEDADV